MRDVYGAENCEVKYLWPGLTLLAMNRLPNKKTLDFKCGRINGHIVDTGGYTYNYLKNNPVSLKSLGKFPHGKDYENYRNYPIPEKVSKYKEMDFDDKTINWLLKYPWINVEFYSGNQFLHYSNGRTSNEWKTRAVVELLETILNE